MEVDIVDDLLLGEMTRLPVYSRRDACEAAKDAVKVPLGEADGLCQVLKGRQGVGARVEQAAGLADHGVVCLVERESGLATLAGPEASFFCLVDRVVKDYVFATRQTGSADGAAVDSGGLDAVEKGGGGAWVLVHEGLPARLECREHGLDGGIVDGDLRRQGWHCGRVNERKRRGCGVSKSSGEG